METLKRLYGDGGYCLRELSPSDFGLCISLSTDMWPCKGLLHTLKILGGNKLNKFQKFCITSLKIIIGIALFFIFFRAKEIIEWNNNDTFSYNLVILLLSSTLIGTFIILSKLSTKSFGKAGD